MGGAASCYRCAGLNVTSRVNLTSGVTYGGDGGARGRSPRALSSWTVWAAIAASRSSGRIAIAMRCLHAPASRLSAGHAHVAGSPSLIVTMYSWSAGVSWLALRTRTPLSMSANSNASYWARFSVRSSVSSCASECADMCLVQGAFRSARTARKASNQPRGGAWLRDDRGGC